MQKQQREKFENIQVRQSLTFLSTHYGSFWRQFYGSHDQTDSVIALKDDGQSTTARANPTRLSSLKDKEKDVSKTILYIQHHEDRRHRGALKTDRQTDRDRQTDKRTDRQTETNRQRQTDRQTDRGRQTETERQTDIQTETDRQTDKDRQTERDRQTETDRQRQTETETDRQTVIQ